MVPAFGSWKVQQVVTCSEARVSRLKHSTSVRLRYMRNPRVAHPDHSRDRKVPLRDEPLEVARASAQASSELLVDPEGTLSGFHHARYSVSH